MYSRPTLMPTYLLRKSLNWWHVIYYVSILQLSKSLPQFRLATYRILIALVVAKNIPVQLRVPAHFIIVSNLCLITIPDNILRWIKGATHDAM